MELLRGAEELVQVRAHGKVGDGEVAHDAQSETDTRDRRSNRVVREVLENIALCGAAELEISANCVRGCENAHEKPSSRGKE